MKLTPRQIKFCELYVQTGNATQSYLEAGYKVKDQVTAQANSSRMLLNDMVRAHIEKIQESLSLSIRITTEKLMEELAKIAFSNLNNIVAIVDGELVLKETDDLNQLDGLSASKAESGPKFGGKNGNSSSKTTTFSIKRADRLKALDMLAKMIGAYGRRESDNSKILRDNAPRVLETLKKYRKYGNEA